MCAEPEKSDSTREVQKIQPVITIPLNNKSEYPIMQPQINDWAELYPGVDVISELRAIKGWNMSNPTKRKTKSGILRHINTWLSDKQNKAASTRQAGGVYEASRQLFKQQRDDIDRELEEDFIRATQRP